ncbi:hypothetical protein NDN08_005885 [Rhodosorus marinus]|uniref:BTB domain-containing protein n=1 Tax=Rhodosorus marinus TaxID=101924 RepID=A0AAV8V4G5_9RHOD|nr:hypothetical protein NDN08_005885 [Rhodosorus marinus]
MQSEEEAETGLVFKEVGYGYVSSASLDSDDARLMREDVGGVWSSDLDDGEEREETDDGFIEFGDEEAGRSAGKILPAIFCTSSAFHKRFSTTRSKYIDKTEAEIIEDITCREARDFENLIKWTNKTSTLGYRRKLLNKWEALNDIQKTKCALLRVNFLFRRMYGYSVKEHDRFLISSEPEAIEFMADTAISVATSLVYVASRLSPESGSVVSRACDFVLNELDFRSFEDKTDEYIAQKMLSLRIRSTTTVVLSPEEPRRTVAVVHSPKSLVDMWTRQVLSGRKPAACYHFGRSVHTHSEEEDESDAEELAQQTRIQNQQLGHNLKFRYNLDREATEDSSSAFPEPEETSNVICSVLLLKELDRTTNELQELSSSDLEEITSITDRYIKHVSEILSDSALHDERRRPYLNAEDVQL